MSLTCFFLAGSLFLSDGVTVVNISTSTSLQLSKGWLYYNHTDDPLRTEEKNLKELLLNCEAQAEKEIAEKLSGEYPEDLGGRNELYGTVTEASRL